jgi:hypothetical protein
MRVSLGAPVIAVSPRLVVDRARNAMVIWRNADLEIRASRLDKSLPTNPTWKPSVRASASAPVNREPAMAVGPSGDIAVLWYQQDAGELQLARFE